jgi:hypothetical protein
MEKVKRENIGDHLFTFELDIIGKTRLDIIDDDRWFYHFTMTREQYIIFKDYAVSLMMKTFRCNKNKALQNFEWYWQMFGVRIKN